MKKKKSKKPTLSQKKTFQTIDRKKNKSQAACPSCDSKKWKALFYRLGKPFNCDKCRYIEKH